MEKRVIEGRWWLAGTDEVVAGNLIYDEKGWTLELNGTFLGAAEKKLRNASSGNGFFDRPDSERTILGLTKDGKPITLDFFAINSYLVVFSGYDSEGYSINRVFENVHFPDPNRITFRKVQISMPYLFEWSDESLIDAETVRDDNGRNVEKVFKCKAGRKISIGKLENIRLALQTYVKIPPLFYPTKSIALQQDTVLILESDSPNEIRLEDFRAAAFAVRDLLVLATGFDVPIHSMIAFTERNREKFPNGKTYDPEVVIHDDSTRTVLPVKQIRRDSMNFTYGDIAPNADTILRRWFAKSRELNDVCNIYFATLNNPYLNVRNKFLNLMSAVEGFARIKLQMRDERELKKIIEAMHKLVQPYGHLLAAEEIDLVRNTRDKLSHVELSDPTRKTLDDYQLVGAVQKMAALFEISLLLDLGWDESSLKKMAEWKISSAKNDR